MEFFVTLWSAGISQVWRSISRTASCVSVVALCLAMASASGCSSVSEESATLTHVRITETADDGMIIEIPNRLLLTWHSQVATKSEYVKLLNESIPGRVVMVKEDASRVAGILATAASRTKSKDRKVRGRERMNLRSGSASIRVSCYELLL